LKATFFTSAGEKWLYDNIEKNIDVYCSDEMQFKVKNVENEIRTINKEVSDCILNIKMGEDKLDYNAAVNVYKAYRSLSSLQASDGRFWSYLCHVKHYEYVKSRWAVKPGAKKPIDSIKSRYFVRNRRDLSRNAIARLWWAAHLTYDSNANDPYWRTKVLFKNQDMFAQLMERSISNNKTLLNYILEAVYQFESDDAEEPQELGKKETQKLIKFISIIGGRKQLDTLSKDDVFSLVESFYGLARENLDYVLSM
jgi:hypothetical protein